MSQHTTVHIRQTESNIALTFITTFMHTAAKVHKLLDLK